MSTSPIIYTTASRRASALFRGSRQSRFVQFISGSGMGAGTAGTLYTTASFATGRSIQLAAINTNSQNTINVVAGTTLTVNGVISNIAASPAVPGLIKSGGGTMLLNTLNTFGADNGITCFFINAGTVQLGIANAILILDRPRSALGQSRWESRTPSR